MRHNSRYKTATQHHLPKYLRRKIQLTTAEIDRIATRVLAHRHIPIPSADDAGAVAVCVRLLANQAGKEEENIKTLKRVLDRCDQVGEIGTIGGRARG